MASLQSTVAVYPIGVVQRLTGLSARQIRYYEKEGLLRPVRTRGNRRLYSPADVERLRQVKALLEQGLNLEGVRAYLASQGRQEPPDAPFSPASPATAAARAHRGEMEGTARAAPEAAPSPGAAGAGPAREEARSPLPAEAEEEPSQHHPAIFRQARGRRLSSLFPVDQQAELVRWLESRRGGTPSGP